MSQVLQKLRDVNPTDSDAVKEVITSFFQNLLKHTEENCSIWLRVLEDVINRFPRYCSQHRPTIENYLAHFLKSSNYYNVIVAAKCAHGLQQIRPSQDKVASPKNCWREQMAILCNTAHTLIETIFSNTINIYKTNTSAKKKDPELLANSPLTKALSNILKVKKSPGSSNEDKRMVLCNQLRNIFVFIQAMLVEVYPVAKPVQPQLILEVIVQALSVSSSVNTDAKEAATVKTQALRTLDAMILCLGPNLIPFSGLVFRFVMQTLKWSSENPSEESRKVRITAYNSLTKWLSILNVHRVSTEGRGRSWEEELTKHIIEDITPVKKIVQLTMSNQYTKNLSKKAKRKLANQTLQQSAIASHSPGDKNKANVSDETNDEVANAALECVETFLTVSGIFLKPTTHKTFQERLVRECFNLDNYSVVRSLYLLRALDAARKNTGTTVPPPTQYCVQLYSMLVNSRCDEIRKFCSQALLDIRLHLHCSPPSINFALEAPPDTQANKNKRKEISEENRDALESIINEGAGPSTAKDAVAEIMGEPSTKKPRLEADRISISSDSEVSVVIPDRSDDEVEEIDEENNDLDVGVDVDEVEGLPEPEESNEKTSGDGKHTTDVTVAVVDSVDTTDAYQNNRKRKLSESIGKDSIYDAKTQIPSNTSPENIDDDQRPGSLEIAYDTSIASPPVAVHIENLEEDNLPSTNETDDVQITCGQNVVLSQEFDNGGQNVVLSQVSDNGGQNVVLSQESDNNRQNVVSSQESDNGGKNVILSQESDNGGQNVVLSQESDNVELEIEISTVDTKAANNEENVESQENGDAVAPNENNIEVKITSKEISVEDMLADFVDEVNEEPNLVA